MIDVAARREAYAGIRRSIRRVLLVRRVITEERRVDADDRLLIRSAADAMCQIFVLDARLRRGPLTPAQLVVYGEAAGVRDACLRSLGIADPYAGAPAN